MTASCEQKVIRLARQLAHTALVVTVFVAAAPAADLPPPPAPAGPVFAPPSDGHGLRAEYFAAGQSDKILKTRYDPEINFDWGMARPDPTVPAEFGVRWTGFLRTPEPGAYRLVTYADDSIKLWLDDKLVIDGGGRQEVTVDLGRQPVGIRAEYQNARGWATATLHWRPPGSRFEWPLPTDVLYVSRITAAKAKPGRLTLKPPPRGTGLSAEIFPGIALQGRPFKRVDRKLDWFLGDSALGPGLPADNFSVRWTTWLKAPQPGRYKLILHHDDGARLYLDGKLRLDAWDRLGINHAVIVDLTDRPHSLVVEYCEVNAGARITLHWEQPDGPLKEEIIPAEAFFTDKAAAMKR